MTESLIIPSWKALTRIVESNLWLHTGPPKKQTMSESIVQRVSIMQRQLILLEEACLPQINKTEIVDKKQVYVTSPLRLYHCCLPDGSWEGWVAPSPSVAFPWVMGNGLGNRGLVLDLKDAKISWVAESSLMSKELAQEPQEVAAERTCWCYLLGMLL